MKKIISLLLALAVMFSFSLTGTAAFAAEIKYSDIVIPELVNLKKLTDEIIKDIVFKIPDDLLTEKHKKYIVLYLIKRRNILLAMIGE